LESYGIGKTKSSGTPEYQEGGSSGETQKNDRALAEEDAYSARQAGREGVAPDEAGGLTF
jgi:hypothetical protein